jgi:hypothetical protein
MVRAVFHKYILYLLAFFVSFVGLNIHVGVTLYISRLIIIVFLLSLIFGALQGKTIRFPRKSGYSYIQIFVLITCSQLLSIYCSGIQNIVDGLIQLFINLAVMALFITTITVAVDLNEIVKAVKIYISAAAIQGVYGIYQVFAAPYGWPTYQTVLAGIPTANDRTEGGVQYFSAYQAFRATGFFPADVSHFSGYLAGSLLITISLFYSSQKRWHLSLVLLICCSALLLTFSRSGILSFFVFGVPSVVFLLWRANLGSRKSSFGGIKSALPYVAVGISLLILLDRSWPELELSRVLETLGARLTDLTNSGDSEVESMATHLETRLLGIDAFLSSPLIGVGMGLITSPWYSETYQTTWHGAHAHHLDILGETGVFGAMLQWILMGMVVRYMWRGLLSGRSPSLGRNLLAGILSAYITIIFGNFLYRYYLNDFVWFLMGVGVALSRLLIIQAKLNLISNERQPTESNSGVVVRSRRAVKLAEGVAGVTYVSPPQQI